MERRRHIRSGSQWLENLSLGALSCIGLFSTWFMPVGETSNFFFNQSIYTYSPLLFSPPLFLVLPCFSESRLLAFPLVLHNAGHSSFLQACLQAGPARSSPRRCDLGRLRK